MAIRLKVLSILLILGAATSLNACRNDDDPPQASPTPEVSVAPTTDPAETVVPGSPTPDGTPDVSPDPTHSSTEEPTPEASPTETQVPTADPSPSPGPSPTGDPTPEGTAAPSPGETATPGPTEDPSPTPAVDNDGDGFPVAQDCDDQDPETYPGAFEKCDRKDNNCDGSADSGVPSLYFRDQDQDGFGAEDEAALLCAPLVGYSDARGDCDDLDPSAHPGAPDPSGDTLDLDCGGSDGRDPHVGLSLDSLDFLQDAMEEAQDGTVIWVGPDTYEESILDFLGKAVRLRSTHMADRTTLVVDDGVYFTGNEGSDSVLDGLTISGIGVNVEDASPTIIDCRFRGNSFPYGAAGYFGYSFTTFTRCTFENNSASFVGGALYLESADLNFIQCRFEGNEVSGSGGAIYAYRSKPRFEGCVFANNSALGLGGGGALFLEESAPYFSHSILEGNLSGSSETESRDRSAPQVARASAVHQVEITSGVGGGVYATSSSATFNNCVISGNFARSRGGGLYLEDSSITLFHTVVLHNEAGGDGGGIYSLGAPNATASILNSVLAYNVPYNLFVDPASSPPFSVLYSNLYIETSTGNTNLTDLDESNLTVDPGFLVSDEEGVQDLHLDLDSPLIDAGDPGIIDPDLGRADIGCYGGPAGGGWNRDGDARPDYFWPGSFSDVPFGVDSTPYDCRDDDPVILDCP